jgi:hypothetical protein
MRRTTLGQLSDLSVACRVLQPEPWLIQDTEASASSLVYVDFRGGIRMVMASFNVGCPAGPCRHEFCKLA